MIAHVGGLDVVPLLGAMVRWPLLGAGCHCWVPLRGAIAGRHCCVPLGANAGCHCWGAMVGCHCWVPPFSAAPFSTHKLVCAIWGLCWYIFFKSPS